MGLKWTNMAYPKRTSGEHEMRQSTLVYPCSELIRSRARVSICTYQARCYWQLIPNRQDIGSNG